MTKTVRLIAISLLAAAALAAAPRARADFFDAAPARALAASARALPKGPVACADWAPIDDAASGRVAPSDAALILDGKGHPTAKYRLGSAVLELTFSKLWVSAAGQILAGGAVIGHLDPSMKPVLDDGYSLRVVLGRGSASACIWGPAAAK